MPGFLCANCGAYTNDESCICDEPHLVVADPVIDRMATDIIRRVLKLVLHDPSVGLSDMERDMIQQQLIELAAEGN